MRTFTLVENYIETTYHVDGRKLLAITQEQDVEDVFDDNKRMQNGEKQVGEMRLTAQIPPIFILKWLNEETAGARQYRAQICRTRNSTRSSSGSCAGPTING